MVEAQKSRVSQKLREAVAEAVSRSQDYFARTQAPKGYWWGELESNPTMEAEYLLLTHFLGIPDPKRWGKIVCYLKSKQLPDGGWSYSSLRTHSSFVTAPAVQAHDSGHSFT